MRQFDVRTRLVILGISVGLLATCLVALGRDADRSPVQATPTAGCAEALLVLVAGNAEGNSTRPTGVGRTMGYFKERFLARARSAGRTVEVRTIDYRTASTSALGSSTSDRRADRVITATRVARWDRGIDGAVTATRTLLTQRASACPQQDIVLGGYAQGAGVMHRVLTKLPPSSPITRRVVGAALVSDPDRRKGTRGYRMGRVPATSAAIGIEQARRTRYADVPLLDTYLKVYSVCRYADLVCDLRGQRVSTGLNRHRSYKHANADQLDLVAAKLFFRMRAVPRPRPALTEVEGTAGASLRRQLVVDVNSVHRRYVRFSPLSALPSGLTLSADGVLSGVPAVPGTTTVSYRVRNAYSRAYSRPVTGQMQISIGRSKAINTVGGDTSCTVRSDGTMYCWGDNVDGQLGIGSRTNQLKPTRMGSATNWATASTGGTHTCGVRRGGSLWCWGLNNYGQVGDHTRTTRLRPVQVGTFTTWASVSTNIFSTCAITRAGGLWCWGKNDEGQLGNGSDSTRLGPARVSGPSGWSSVSVGAFHTCATRTDTSLWCWGSNTFAQLGNGASSGRVLTPAQVLDGVAQVGTGAMNSCALLSAGSLRCWGANTSGQVGDGTRSMRRTPTAVAAQDTFVDLAVGDRFACAVTTDSVVKCWGVGTTGQLARSGVAGSLQPVAIGSSTKFAQVSGGGWGHLCGVQPNGTTSCWGFNSAGQIGDGTHSTRFQPVTVMTG